MDAIQLLMNDVKTAMKAGEKQKLDSLRYLMAQLKNLQIDKGRDAQVDEADLQGIVKKMLKNSEEAVAQYAAGGRIDLVEEEKAKMVVWATYLPQQLSDEELLVIIKEVQAANPGLGAGPLTGMVMKQVSGRADGSRVSGLIKTL